MPGKKAAVALLILTGCSIVKDSKKPSVPGGSIAYQLSCHSLADVKTWVTYTVTASADPVAVGDEVTLRISAPPAEAPSPLPVTFEESTVTYPVPAGFELDEAVTDPPSTHDIDHTDVTIQNGAIVLHETGSFSLDGKAHDLPFLVATGHITAASGTAIDWMTPSELDGRASVSVLGDQTSKCQVISPGPIWTIHVL